MAFAANRSRRWAVCPSPNTESYSRIYMKGTPKQRVEEEPIGIVISRGPRNDPPPTFLAYMWAPDPEETDEVAEPKVA